MISTPTDHLLKNTNQADHFLEVIRLLKAEIVNSVNTQIATLAAQIQNLQFAQHMQGTQHMQIQQETQRPSIPYPMYQQPQPIPIQTQLPVAPQRGYPQPLQRMLVQNHTPNQ